MKKVLKIGSILVLSLCVIYLGIYFAQNVQIKKSLEDFNKKKLDDQHALVRCNLNIFKPEFAYIFFDEDISFDSLNKIFWDKVDWESSYIGGTTITNTTFSKLLSMAKDDCSQFKKSGRNGDIEWIFSKPSKLVELTPEEENRRIEEINRQAIEEAEANGDVEMTDEEVQQYIKDMYGSEPGFVEN